MATTATVDKSIEDETRNLLSCACGGNISLSTLGDIEITVKTILSHGMASVEASNTPGRWIVYKPCVKKTPESIGFIGGGCSDTKSGVLAVFMAEALSKPKKFDAYRSVLTAVSDWWSRQPMMNGLWLDFQFAPRDTMRIPCPSVVPLPSGSGKTKIEHDQLETVLAALYDVVANPARSDQATTKTLLAQYRDLTGKDLPGFMH
jgi:hypothetical protein